MHYSKLSNIVKNYIERMINMDQFMVMLVLVLGIIVLVVCYTIIQMLGAIKEFIDKPRYKTVQGLAPGRLYARPNNPPPPVRLSASEELKQYIADEILKRHAANLKRLQGEHKMRYNSALQEKAIEAARKVLIENLGHQTINSEDMFIVWFCKTLQNWKAIVSGRTIEEFIEVTHNGDRNETYVDVYYKTKNVCIKDNQ